MEQIAKDAHVPSSKECRLGNNKSDAKHSGSLYIGHKVSKYSRCVWLEEVWELSAAASDKATTVLIPTLVSGNAATAVPSSR